MYIHCLLVNNGCGAEEKTLSESQDPSRLTTANITITNTLTMVFWWDVKKVLLTNSSTGFFFFVETV